MGNQLMLSGYLDILWIDAVLFMNLKKRVTFRFYIDAANKLTLHGWSRNDDNYNDDPPDVYLLSGKPSQVEIKPDTYFGNLQLKHTDIEIIIGLLKPPNPAKAFVLFVPEDPATNFRQISYVLKLTNDNPTNPLFDPIKNVILTDVRTNPSPPRKGV